MILNNTKEWIHTCTPPFGFLFAKIALFSYDAFFFINQRARNITKLEIPPHKVYKMYRQHKFSGNLASHLFASSIFQVLMNSTFADQLRKRIEIAEENEGSLNYQYYDQKVTSAFKRIGFANLNYHANTIIQGNTIIDATVREQIECDQHLRFLLGYLLPIWLEYSEYVLPLYIEARRGSIIAIEKLLRVDKTIIHDPKIASHFEKTLRKPESPQFARLHNALGYDFYSKFTLQKSKILASGLIFSISEAFELGLSKPDIRELYYCLHSDMFNKRLDQDLCELSDANFRVKINSSKAFWSEMFNKFPDLEAWLKRHEHLAKKFYR